MKGHQGARALAAQSQIKELEAEVERLRKALQHIARAASDPLPATLRETSDYAAFVLGHPRPGEAMTVREQAVLDALQALDGWADPRTIRRVAVLTATSRRARPGGLMFAPGTTRAILDRLADRGACERQPGPGTDAQFRRSDP